MELIKDVHSLPGTLRVIVGPPGPGKATMLSYIRRYADEMGFDVAHITKTDFKSLEHLAVAFSYRYRRKVYVSSGV